MPEIDVLTRTCSGRKNWGIPKHLARFAFSHPPATPGTGSPDQPLKIEVFAPDDQATKPFFSATLQPLRWAPAMPFTTKIMPYSGLDVHLVQPPLPASRDPDEDGETSSEGWLKCLPDLYSPRARGMWVDLHQGGGASATTKPVETTALLGNADLDQWWPKTNPWRLGLWLEQATLTFPAPDVLTG